MTLSAVELALHELPLSDVHSKNLNILCVIATNFLRELPLSDVATLQEPQHPVFQSYKMTT